VQAPATPNRPLLEGLNPAQREAVSTLGGPLLVLAGAGSGKTRVVTYRIAELIRNGTRPERILGVTFTNKAAAEMQQRIAALLGRRVKRRPEISTFHSLCVRILRRRIELLGYPPNFSIYDRGDQESVARSVLREIRAPSNRLKPSDLIWRISGWKSSGIDPPRAIAAASTDKDHLAASGYRRYQKALKAAGAVDFDDLLLVTEELFAKHDDARREEAARFDHVLVDEYQDTNPCQYRIVRDLAIGHRNLCVVGDDDQSIYGWRGAEVAHILRFSKDWPDAKVVRLEENYRSTAEILTVANRLIAFNKERYPKVLRAARPGGQRPRVLQCKDEEAEAQQVAADIESRLTEPGREPRDIAVLFRTNEQPRAFETEFRRRGLPYVLIGGMSFFDRKEVRDVMAYLRVLATPDDDAALRRIINVPARGISQKAAIQLAEAAAKEGKSAYQMLARATAAGVSPTADRAAADLHRLLGEFRDRARREPLADVATALLRRIDYQQELERQYSDAQEQQSRWAAVEQVVNALAAYESQAESPSLNEFLDSALTGDREFGDEKERQMQRNAVVLLTLHSAKGLEFPEVYMVGLEEGLLPHRRSLAENADDVAEERRLCYVGVTRAQERLTLSLAQARRKWGKLRESQPSRFLFELTGQAER